ncbi:hypothetical protein GCM10010170_025940 [Dactylosporangium salmoneum]|uniref:Uncharacterized protein n=1 Tax=Dactylosporangium salmoneum TaxID=53361 RepID=A0ABP5SZD9_9ACTN
MLPTRHSIVIANVLITAARLRIASPVRAGRYMSRAELAGTVNGLPNQADPAVRPTGNHVDVRWIGKLERGEHR